MFFIHKQFKQLCMGGTMNSINCGTASRSRSKMHQMTTERENTTQNQKMKFSITQ